MSFCCSQCNFTAQFESALMMHHQLHHESSNQDGPSAIDSPHRHVSLKSATLPADATPHSFLSLHKNKGFRLGGRTSSATRLFNNLKTKICRSRMLFSHSEEPESSIDVHAESRDNGPISLSDCTSKALKVDSVVSHATTLACLEDGEGRETFPCHLCNFEADRITVLDRHLLNHHKIGLENLLKLVMAKTKDGLSDDRPPVFGIRQPYYKPQDEIIEEGEFIIETVAPKIKILKHSSTNTEVNNNLSALASDIERLFKINQDGGQNGEQDGGNLMSKMAALNQYMCKFVDSSNTLKKVLNQELEMKTEHLSGTEAMFKLGLGERESPRDWELDRAHSEKMERNSKYSASCRITRNVHEEMKYSKAVYVTKHKIREDQNFVYQLYAKHNRDYKYDKGNNFACQYDSKNEYPMCTCKVPKRQKLRYVYGSQRSSAPRLICAYHASSSYTDIGVGSVKALQKRRVRKIYLPETDDRGCGSSDLTSFIIRKNKPQIGSYYDYKKTSSKCVGGILEYKMGCVLSQKLSPIYWRKSNTTNTTNITEQTHTEIGSNTIGSSLVTTGTQFEIASQKSVGSSIKSHYENSIKIASNKEVEIKSAIQATKVPIKVSKQTSKVKKASLEQKSKSIEKRTKDAVSSDSLVEHVHNLEDPCNEKNSGISVDPMENKLEREYRRLFSTKNKESFSKTSVDKPMPEMKSASIVKRRFEALRRGLTKKDEAKKSVSPSSQDSVQSHKDESISSDPPSLEGRSFTDTKKFTPIQSNAKNTTLTINEVTENQQENAWPQKDTSSENQGAKGMFKLWGKKFDLEEDQRAKHSQNLNKNALAIDIRTKPHKEKNVAEENKKNKKKFFFFKKKPKEKPELEDDKEREIYQASGVTAGRCEIPDGLTMKLGHSQPTELLNIPPDAYSDSSESDEIKRRSWLKKFLSNTIESTRSVNVRWNNSLYAASSSTVFELMDTIYMNTDLVLDSRSDIITDHSSYYTRSPKNKVNFDQKIEAWMIPTLIPDRPNDTIINIRSCDGISINLASSDPRWVIEKSRAFANKIEVVLHSNNYNRTTNKVSSDYLRIDIPKDFFDISSSDASKQDPTSDEEVFKIVEYESNLNTQVLNKGDHAADNINIVVSLQDSQYLETKILTDIETVIKRPPMVRDVVTQGSNVIIPKRCDVIGVGIITQREIRKPILKIQDISDNESEEDFHVAPQKKCEFAESYLQDYYRHLQPISADLFAWCASESHVKSGSERSLTSLLNQGDGSKSCPNICDDYQSSAVVSSYNTSSCSQCYEPASFSKKLLSKILKPVKAKTDTDVTCSGKRILPKDSLEVFKRRKIYAAGLKSTWKCDDNPVSVPSIASKGAQNSIFIECPKCSKVDRYLYKPKTNKRNDKHARLREQPIQVIPLSSDHTESLVTMADIPQTSVTLNQHESLQNQPPCEPLHHCLSEPRSRTPTSTSSHAKKTPKALLSKNAAISFKDVAPLASSLDFMQSSPRQQRSQITTVVVGRSISRNSSPIAKGQPCGATDSDPKNCSPEFYKRSKRKSSKVDSKKNTKEPPLFVAKQKQIEFKETHRSAAPIKEKKQIDFEDLQKPVTPENLDPARTEYDEPRSDYYNHPRNLNDKTYTPNHDQKLTYASKEIRENPPKVSVSSEEYRDSKCIIQTCTPQQSSSKMKYTEYSKRAPTVNTASSATKRNSPCSCKSKRSEKSRSLFKKAQSRPSPCDCQQEIKLSFKALPRMPRYSTPPPCTSPPCKRAPCTPPPCNSPPCKLPLCTPTPCTPPPCTPPPCKPPLSKPPPCKRPLGTPPISKRAPCPPPPNPCKPPLCSPPPCTSPLTPRVPKTCYNLPYPPRRFCKSMSQLCPVNRPTTRPPLSCLSPPCSPPPFQTKRSCSPPPCSPSSCSPPPCPQPPSSPPSEPPPSGPPTPNAPPPCTPPPCSPPRPKKRSCSPSRSDPPPSSPPPCRPKRLCSPPRFVVNKITPPSDPRQRACSPPPGSPPTGHPKPPCSPPRGSPPPSPKTCTPPPCLPNGSGTPPKFSPPPCSKPQFSHNKIKKEGTLTPCESSVQQYKFTKSLPCSPNPKRKCCCLKKPRKCPAIRPNSHCATECTNSSRLASCCPTPQSRCRSPQQCKVPPGPPPPFSPPPSPKPQCSPPASSPQRSCSPPPCPPARCSPKTCTTTPSPPKQSAPPRCRSPPRCPSPQRTSPFPKPRCSPPLCRTPLICVRPAYSAPLILFRSLPPVCPLESCCCTICPGSSPCKVKPAETESLAHPRFNKVSDYKCGPSLKVPSEKNNDCFQNCETEQEFIQLNSCENLTVIRKKSSTDTTRDGMNIKVRDCDGHTVYERNDCSIDNEGRRSSFLNEVLYKNSDVHGVSTAMICHMPTGENDAGVMAEDNSEGSIGNLLEIQFKLRITKGDKTTEINIGNDGADPSIEINNNNHQQIKSKINIEKVPTGVFLVKKDTKEIDESIEEINPKHDINIKIVVKSYKTLSNKDTEIKKNKEIISKKISQKFNTVSTCYNDFNTVSTGYNDLNTVSTGYNDLKTVTTECNDFNTVSTVNKKSNNVLAGDSDTVTNQMEHEVISIQRTGVDLNSWEKTNKTFNISMLNKDSVHLTEDDKTGLESNVVVSSNVYASSMTDASEFDKTTSIKNQDDRNEKSEYVDTTVNEKELNTSQELLDLITSDECSDVKYSSKVIKKQLLKKVLEKTHTKPKNKENVRQLRDMLQIILTDSSENDESSTVRCELVKDVTYKSLNQNYFRNTDSMINYYRSGSSQLIDDFKRAQINSADETSVCSDSDKPEYQGCMCSLVAKNLNCNLRNSCCCKKTKINESISCYLLSEQSDSDSDEKNVETQISKQTSSELQFSANKANYLVQYKTEPVIDILKRDSDTGTNILKINTVVSEYVDDYTIQYETEPVIIRESYKNLLYEAVEDSIVPENHIIKPTIRYSVECKVDSEINKENDDDGKEISVSNEVETYSVGYKAKPIIMKESYREEKNIEETFISKDIRSTRVAKIRTTVLGISDDDKIVVVSEKKSKENRAQIKSKRKDNSNNLRLLKKSDMLQCYAVKKAVLEIYAEKTNSENGEHLVAKLPKFLNEKEGKISKKLEDITSNCHKSVGSKIPKLRIKN